MYTGCCNSPGHVSKLWIATSSHHLQGWSEKPLCNPYMSTTLVCTAKHRRGTSQCLQATCWDNRNECSFHLPGGPCLPICSPDMLARQPNLAERHGHEIPARKIELWNLTEIVLLRRFKPETISAIRMVMAVPQVVQFSQFQ